MTAGDDHHHDAPRTSLGKPEESEATPPLSVLYNGSCPICSAEIAHYRAMAPDDAALAWIDVSRDDASDFGVDPDRALRRLHAREPGGPLLAGVDGFIALWQRLPRYRWLARLSRLPLIKQGLSLVYERILAPWLYHRHLRRMAAQGA